MMKYYHGTDVYFKEFILSYSGTRKDFGVGIYLVEKYPHAEAIVKRRRSSEGYVYAYDVNMNDMRKLFKVREYRSASVEWVKFIIANRINMSVVCDADIVRGPTADAATNTVISTFMDSVDNPTDADYKKLALQLKANVYPIQICLKTKQAVDYFNNHRVAERRVE